MESVMMIFFIILLIFFVYGYSNYYFYKHRTDKKTIFIPKTNIKDDNDGFAVGGQEFNASNIVFNSNSTCNPNASFSFDGNNDMVCINGGECIPKLNSSGIPTDTYYCNCKETFSGDNCSENIGQSINIMDKFTSPTEIDRVAMFEKTGKNYYIQDNNYL